MVACLTSTLPVALAQNSDGPAWSAMRIFVEEKDVDAAVKGNYLAVELAKMEQLLAAEAQRRQLSAGQAEGIKRAVYVARWIDGQLISPASVWQVVMPGSNGPLPLSRMSLALEEPQGLGGEIVPLARHLQYVNDERLQIAGLTGSQDLWFGFKAKARRRDLGQQSIELNLPKAVVATLLVAVPSQFQLTSNLPLAPLSDLSGALPESWPPKSLPITAADDRWFIVWLSGSENCTLNFTPQDQSGQIPYRLTLPSSQCDVQISASGIQVNSRFKLARAPLEGKVRLQLEEPLHVRSVSIDGVESRNWRSLPENPASASVANASVNASVANASVASADGSQANAGNLSAAINSAGPTAANKRSRWIEVPCDTPGDAPVSIAVESIGRLALPFEGDLPRVSIAQAYVLDGRCTLTSQDNVQIDDAQCNAHTLSNSSQSGMLHWQWQWTGQQPSMRTRLLPGASQWNIDALTRISLQADVVVASVHANVSSRTVQGNQLALRLAGGWFVDSVELENAPLGVSAQVYETTDGGSELNIRWEERRSDLDVRVILKAHFHQSTDVDNLRLPATRILSLAGANQTDTYVIEPSGQFRLEVDPELLRLRAREEELTTWQRDLLPRLGEAWIFRGGRASLPAIRLERIKATFEARLHTTVLQQGSEFKAIYRVVCQPISGSIKQLRILLPLPQAAVAPTWSLVPNFDGTSPEGLSAFSSAISSSSGETTFTVVLTKEMSLPFQLQAELRLDESVTPPQAGNPWTIPLPAVPQAVSQDAVMVLPAQLRLPDNVRSLEVLPAGLCCQDGHIAEATDAQAPDVVAARYDPSSLSRLNVYDSSGQTPTGWIQQALHEHWHYTGGPTVHRSTWLLTTPMAQSLTFRVPASWEVQSLQVAGQRIEPGKSRGVAQANHQVIEVPVPQGNQVRVELLSSSRPHRAWISSLRHTHPECDLRVQDQQEIAWFPPGVLAFHASPLPTDEMWIERFKPSRWWELISLSSFASTTTRQPVRLDDEPAALSPVMLGIHDDEHASDNWWPMPLADHSQAVSVWSVASVWSIDRSLAACALLSLFLVQLCLWLLICRRSWRRWLSCWAIAGATLCLVTTAWLWLVQLTCLAVFVASWLAWARWLLTSVAPAGRRSDSVHLPTGKLSKVAGVCLGMLCLWGSEPAHAQSMREPSQLREVFGILIPVDESQQLAGEYVYVHPRLYNLLRGSQASDNLASVVTVTTAFYSLTLSNNPLSQMNEASDLTVELIVQANRTDAQLQLPFIKSELLLQRAYLDSQILTVGDQVKQEDQSVLWRAPDAERHTLRMFFRARNVVQREGRSQLTATIPAIPTARLDLLGDDLRDASVDSLGGMQLESIRAISARLGPVNKLNISWPVNAPRNVNTQVQSDTWVHSRGDQIMALCQLRLRGAASLPKQLAIIGDANWQPLGQDWQDFRLLGTQGSIFGRTGFTLERINESSDELIMRVMMLPRESGNQSLSIPFLMLQQPLSATTRTLAVSHTDSPLWKVVGTEGWQTLLASQAIPIWDKSRLTEQPTLWKAPTGSLQVTMQRVPTPPTPTVDEVTEISFHLPETKLKYVAKWASPIVGISAVRLEVPSQFRVDGAYVDSLPARHSIHRIPARATDAPDPAASPLNEVVVFVDGSLGGMHTLNLQLSAPSRLNRQFRLPRPLLKGHAINSSAVQLFRGAELLSALQPIEQSGLELRPVDLRPSQYLQDLHTALGQLELGQRFRNSAELPLEIRLSRNNNVPKARAVMRLNRSEQGWRAQLDALIEVQAGQLNPVFFDFPRSLESSLREPLEANAPLMLWPSADSNRAILCMLPAQESVSGDTQPMAHVSLAFRLPSTGASQSITIPDIRLLGMSTQRPVLALPTVVAGQPARWTQVGRALPASWMHQPGLQAIRLNVVDDQATEAFSGPPPTDGEPLSYTLHEPSGSQLQANWQARDDQQHNARILLTRVLLRDEGNVTHGGLQRSVARDRWRGQISWWVDPRNQTYLSVNLNPNLQLIGIKVNDRATHWTQTDEQRVGVLLQPSYLPLRVEALVQWPVDQPPERGDQRHLPLPIAEAPSIGPVLVGQLRSSLAPSDVGEVWNVGLESALQLPEVDAQLAQTWADMLIQSAPTASDRGSDELGSWLPNWEPLRLGLNASSLITVPSQFLESNERIQPEANGQFQISVGEFWQRFSQLKSLWGLSPPTGLANRSELEPRSDSPNDYLWYRDTTLTSSQATSLPRITLHLTTTRRTSAWLTPGGAGAAWVLLCLMVAWLGSWSKLTSYLSELSWPLWGVLALGAWWLLPTSVPAVVVGLGAIIIFVRRTWLLGRQSSRWAVPKAAR